MTMAAKPTMAARPLICTRIPVSPSYFTEQALHRQASRAFKHC